MKKVLISLGFAALALGANAQVKIKDGTAGSTTTVPSNAAILELESAQRGLLLPRVPLSSTTATTLPGGATPVAGLFVYNTATTGSGSTAVFPGMYYYNGNFWVRVIGSASSANDTIVDVNGNLGIGTSNPSQKLDIETGGTAAAPVTGFKLNDGTQGAGKTLTSDANGVATWTVATSPVQLQAQYLGAQINLPANNFVTIPYNTVLNSNVAGALVNGAFTAPYTGQYFVNAGVFLTPFPDGGNPELDFFVNGVRGEAFGLSTGSTGPISGTGVVFLNAGDVLTIQTYSGIATNIAQNSIWSYLKIIKQ